MNRVVWTVLLVVVSLLLLVGCGAKETPTMVAGSEEPTQAVGASEAVATETVPSADTEPAEEGAVEAEMTATAVVEPTTPPPTPTPIVVADVDSACVDCHTDVDRLKELAVEPEEVELSSGEG